MAVFGLTRKSLGWKMDVGMVAFLPQYLPIR